MDLALLPLLLIFPLLSGLMLPWLAGDNPDRIKTFALISTLFTFVFSLGLLVGYDFSDTSAMGLVCRVEWFSSLGLTFSFGVDGLSIWLILLTTLLMPLVVLGSFTAIKTRIREFYIWLLILEAAMLGVFVSTDILFFYICFEFTLIPMYFLIGIYGSAQRLKAARVLFFYTFTGSMLTFAGILYVAYCGGSWNFSFEALRHAHESMTSQQQFWAMLAMLAGFAVKVPLFPFHTWLPLAHTEAPTAGSVVLAGVLLKLGTYALIRIAIPILPSAALTVAPYVGMLAMIGVIYTALICWVQKDIKKLIAYSSVSHLGFCVLGMFALNIQGLSGSVMYMVNHGLSTGALFLLVGMIYERFHTREMAQMQGLARVMPIWASFMVFFCLASVGLPGLNGFVGEFLTLLGAFRSVVLGPAFAAVAGLGLIFGAIYILHMVGKVVWGPLRLPQGHEHDVRDLNGREIAVLVPLAVLCLWIGVYPMPLLQTLDQPAAAIVQRVGTNLIEDNPEVPVPLPRHRVHVGVHKVSLKLGPSETATTPRFVSTGTGRLTEGALR